MRLFGCWAGAHHPRVPVVVPPRPTDGDPHCQCWALKRDGLSLASVTNPDAAERFQDSQTNRKKLTGPTGDRKMNEDEESRPRDMKPASAG
jgi:hypothetical protein